MKKSFAFLFLLALVLQGAVFISPPNVSAQSLAEQTAGYILLDVENAGEAWYVDPVTDTRSYLGRPDDAFEIMREKGLGITNADLANIPEAGSGSAGDASLRARLSGRILLQVESQGEAWYVYPETLTRYYLGRPADAFEIMSSLGLGISEENLALISTDANSLSVASDTSATFVATTVATERGSFPVDLIRIPIDAYEMITDTGDVQDCTTNCTVKSLAEYVSENNGEIGIHGTYFCPTDYSACAGKTNSYYSPVFNTAVGVMINEANLAYHAGPLFTYREDGSYYHYHRTSQYDGEGFSAAIANYPSLVEGGENIVADEPIESSQETDALRGGIGFDEDEVFLVIAKSASVRDLAAIFVALGADYAMNLDGGATTALYFEGEYIDGPNRELPNAIVFRKK